MSINAELTMKNIELTMKNIEIKLDILQKNQKINSDNINKILYILENDNVIDNCKKMGEHIDFIENVYQNIKYPLSYICNKVNSIAFIDLNKNNILELDNK